MRRSGVIDLLKMSGWGAGRMSWYCIAERRAWMDRSDMCSCRNLILDSARRSTLEKEIDDLVGEFLRQRRQRRRSRSRVAHLRESKRLDSRRDQERWRSPVRLGGADLLERQTSVSGSVTKATLCWSVGGRLGLRQLSDGVVGVKQVGATFERGGRTGTRQFNNGRPLPKFGEWDVNDPTSAESFTVIFNKARDEKKTGNSNNGQGSNSPSKVFSSHKQETPDTSSKPVSALIGGGGGKSSAGKPTVILELPGKRFENVVNCLEMFHLSDFQKIRKYYIKIKYVIEGEKPRSRMSEELKIREENLCSGEMEDGILRMVWV
ncbi:RPM1-interacting protein 4 [Platanthera guangdongensis]|uniref:RPM1-interacting protein 4 n=1 Tax=Platanthera guangdongensis TaxID=2320717 RepID=A0ABR2MZU2_9ASPA